MSGESAHLTGCPGSLLSFLLATVQFEQQLLAVLPSDADALNFSSDMLACGVETVYVPPSRDKPLDPEHMTDPVELAAYLGALRRVPRASIIVSSAEVVAEKTPALDTLADGAYSINKGSIVDIEALQNGLYGIDFNRVEYVSEPGEFALRGGIIDIYSFSAGLPVRIELFGDEVDSIRTFDPDNQRSVAHLDTVDICRNATAYGLAPRIPFVDLLKPERALLVIDRDEVERTAEAQFEDARSLNRDEVSDYFLSGNDLASVFDSCQLITAGGFAKPGERKSIGASPQPSFNGHVPMLHETIRTRAAEGFYQIVACDSKTQTRRLAELLEQEIEECNLVVTTAPLSGGWVYGTEKLAVYTDHEIFDRSHRPRILKKRKARAGISLRALRQLNPGDFVVHIDFGVGEFVGMRMITVRDKKQEAIQLRYRGNDTLYVNVSALHKIHKYKGKEGYQPQLTKLGTGQWERTKARTKKRVKDIARDLIKLYAKRRATQGFAFSPDTVWQKELEASFPYDDTPDQASAVEAIKSDMERPAPMDRLLCGDVGFGKTEVAIRSAFKAVQDGKQVAVLVPTTVLAAQHLETFSERLSPFPVRVDMLSRFRNREQQSATLRDTKDGKVDILIGTHRMASKDIGFKDLGLLIVDEEQRFGVGVKEKLRKLRAEIDTLTMTATPIPRTLQFSLMGSRDLSIISTPPPLRQAIETEVHTYDVDLIRDAIMYELARGGQVFFIHNRVQSIDEMASMIRELAPTARTKVAHGQMKSSSLEKVMMDFKLGKFDVLVSTNIIENGLDIANANTIIINRANLFGLSEIHQLRGRVGRSDRKAFCYLLVPSIHKLTREAKQRLNAVEEFSELGSGFHLAMRDMDIRGAGNLLGAEQSGHISDVGFDVYHRILDEAVQELKVEEFADLLEDNRAPTAPETSVDINEDALIPESYVQNRVERLNLYNRINDSDDKDIEEITAEMTDRFGPMPAEVAHLFSAMKLKALGQKLRVVRVAHKNSRLFLSLPDKEEDLYFYDNLFHGLLERLSQLARKYVLKESGSSKKLRVVIQDVETLEEALDILTMLASSESLPSRTEPV